MTDGSPDARGVARPVARNSLLVTYRSLRLALVLAVVMLAVAIVAESVRDGGIRGSISAYFYSPVRSIFVGALLMIGSSLIVIHVAHRWEESWLTLGGMLAIVVAVVPTAPPTCQLTVVTGDAIGAGDPVPPSTVRDIADRALLECFPHASGDPLPGWVVAGAWNNVLAIVVTSLLALWVTRRFTEWSVSGVSAPLKIALTTYAVLLAAGSIAFWLWDGFRNHTHVIAACLTFVCIGAVALINGWMRDENVGWHRATYRGVTVGMIGAGTAFAVAKLIGGGFDNDVFVLEAVEIALFGTFWLTQTLQHWSET